jgi:glycosyltransferase 2 family protein
VRNWLTKNNGLILLKVLITCVFFILILNKVDFDSTIALLQKAEVLFIFLALFVVIMEVFIATIRWKVILNRLEINVPYITALRYLWIGVFFNQALPSSIGGDALRGYFLCKHEGYSVTNATVGVLLDRVFGILGLVILILIVSPLLFELVSDSIVLWGLFLSVWGAFGVVGILMVIDLIPNKWTHWRAIRGLLVFSKKGRKIVFSHYGLLLIALSLTIQLSFVFAVWLLANAIGLHINLISVLLIVPITNLLMALPVSIAGWGVREGVMITGLGYLGVNPEEALALSILYGLLMLAVALPGLLDWLWSKVFKL